MAMRAEEALELLRQGNERFASGTTKHPNQDSPRRAELMKGQNPFAVVITCSDSRVVPELIFDVGLGDIFVIRVAGNVVDDFVLGSVEYAVEHLGVSLVMVLGHGSCGAVTAALGGSSAVGAIASIMDAIRPGVEAAREKAGDALQNAIVENVRNSVKQLEDSDPVLIGKVKTGKLSIVGAFYDLDSGKVDVIN